MWNFYIKHNQERLPVLGPGKASLVASYLVALSCASNFRLQCSNRDLQHTVTAPCFHLI